MSVRLLPSVLLGVAVLFAACEKREPVEILQPPATPATGAALPKLWPIPDFTLTERSGQPLRLGDLAGKVWVADVFYTTCPGPCPILTGRLGEVQKALGSSPDVRFVSVSVDPQSDTTDVLKEYAQRFKAADGWFFCTGEKDAILRLVHDGFKLPIATEGTPESGPITHSTRFILIDQMGTARGVYEGTTEDGVHAVVRDIHRLLDQK